MPETHSDRRVWRDEQKLTVKTGALNCDCPRKNTVLESNALLAPLWTAGGVRDVEHGDIPMNSYSSTPHNETFINLKSDE